MNDVYQAVPEPPNAEMRQASLPGLDSNPVLRELLAHPTRRHITIRTVLNGWVVEVGCQQVVFTDWEALVLSLTQYMKNPAEVEKQWLSRRLEV